MSGRVVLARAGFRIGLHFQEVADHLVAALGEDALGVELHALDGEMAMTQAHDDCAAVPFDSGVRAVTSSSGGRDFSATMSE